jgi:hypothetical protein
VSQTSRAALLLRIETNQPEWAWSPETLRAIDELGLGVLEVYGSGVRGVALLDAEEDDDAQLDALLVRIGRITSEIAPLDQVVVHTGVAAVDSPRAPDALRRGTETLSTAGVRPLAVFCERERLVWLVSLAGAETAASLLQQQG